MGLGLMGWLVEGLKGFRVSCFGLWLGLETGLASLGS